MKLFKLSSLKKRTQVIIVLGIVFLLWNLVPPVPAFFVSLFLVFWVFHIDPKILGFLVILLLISVPSLQYYGMDDKAEQMAVYMYFLLAIIVVLQILDARRKPSGNWIDDKVKVKSAKLKVDEKVNDTEIPEEEYIVHNPKVDTRPRTPTRTTEDGGVEYIVDKKTYRVPRTRDEKGTPRIYPPIEPTARQSKVESLKLKVNTEYEETNTKSKYIQPSYRRDMEKETHTPAHRLATEIKQRTDEEETLPRHLTLPERLKALNEMQKKKITTVKPSLDDLEDKDLRRIDRY